MTTPFDQIAPSYAQLWSDTAKGRAQREQVWREVDRLFQSGDRILDLGCGTGDDAVHLMQGGVTVVALDESTAMVQAAVGRGVDARVLNIEHLSEIEGVFDGALSNFGALNCVEDLRSVSEGLARLVKPGGMVALCVLSRIHPGEWLSNPLRGWKRVRGRASWRGLTIYYRSVSQISRAFSEQFALASSHVIGGGDHTLLTLERLDQ